MERWGLTWWPLLVGSASETDAWSDFTYLRYTWKPPKTKDCFQLGMKVIGRYLQDSTAFSLTWTTHPVFRWHFFDATPGCFGSSLLAEPLAGGEMKWTWDWGSSNPKDAESQHATPRMDAWSMTFHFHSVIFRFCEAESHCWTMVLIPWKELVLSELVYHMLQVAAIVGKPSQQFVDQERCDVPKWTEHPKMRFEPFFGNFTTCWVLFQLYNFGGILVRHLSKFRIHTCHTRRHHTDHGGKPPFGIRHPLRLTCPSCPPWSPLSCRWRQVTDPRMFHQVEVIPITPDGAHFFRRFLEMLSIFGKDRVSTGREDRQIKNESNE